MTSSARRFVLNAVLTIFVLASLVLTGWAVRSVLRTADSETWPVVKGRVTLTDILFSSGSQSAGRRSAVFYTPYVRYEYLHQGTSYTSDVVSFTPEGHSDRAIAEAFLKNYPVGAEVSVHVHPDDPALAVLRPGQNVAMTMLKLLFPVGFLATSVLALAGINLKR